MLHRQYLGVLRRGGSRDGRERLTGRIRHEVKVEVAASTVRHDECFFDLITGGCPVNSWGGGHGRRGSASPPGTGRLKLSTLCLWGHRPDLILGEGSTCGSSVKSAVGMSFGAPIN